MRACAYLAGQIAPAGSRIWTDSDQIVKAIYGEERSKPEELMGLVLELRVALAKHDFALEARYRGDIQGRPQRGSRSHPCMESRSERGADLEPAAVREAVK